MEVETQAEIIPETEPQEVLKIQTSEEYSTILARELLEKPEIYTAIRDYHVDQTRSFAKVEQENQEYNLKIQTLEQQLAKETEAKEKAMGLVYETLKKIPIDTITKNEPEPFSVEKIVSETLKDIQSGVSNGWVK